MNLEKTFVIAIDLGGSSGRIVLGVYDGQKLEMEELHRFNSKVIEENNNLYWDIDYIMKEIKFGLSKGSSFNVKSIGVDTWGVDFALLNEDGELISNPYHYRDSRTKDVIAKTLTVEDEYDLYLKTGNQILEINTLFQLLVSSKKDMEKTNNILMMPDLINYMMTDQILTERSIASTSQMYDFERDNWSQEVLDKFNISQSIMPEIVSTGEKNSCLSESFSTDVSMDRVDVVMVGHDSQSALVSVPADNDEFIFISCGTWSIMGTESAQTYLDEKSYSLGLSHERGYDDKISLHKNITGLWILQDCVRFWSSEGDHYSYEELELKAEEALKFRCFIDVDDSTFTRPGNMINKIKDYCRITNQEIPYTVGEIVRCIYESLAMKYRKTFVEIEETTEKSYEKLYMLGGGSQSDLLCRMTASSCNVPLIAGPVEATALGNIGIQLISCGAIDNLKEFRSFIKKTFELSTYGTEDENEWDQAYQRYLNVLNYKEEK